MTLYVIISEEPVENAFKIEGLSKREIMGKLVDMEIDGE